MQLGHAPALDNRDLQPFCDGMREFDRHGRAPAVAELHARKVEAFARDIHDGAPTRRHHADDGRAKSFDMRPEVPDDVGVAVAGGSQQDHSRALAERREARAIGAANVENGQSVQMDLIRAGAPDLGGRPALQDQAAMGVLRQLGRRGRSTRMEQRGDVVRPHVPRKNQGVRGLRVEFGFEAAAVNACTNWGAADAQNGFERRDLAPDRLDFRPEAGKNVGIRRKKQRASGFAQQRDDMRRFEKEVDRVRHARGLRAEHRDEGFGQQRQQQRH